MSALVQPAKSSALCIRKPTAADGKAVWALVKRVGTLELNSAYSYLLLCEHFSETCLLAEHGDELAGFVTAYLPPAKTDTVFVWQIGVAPQARGQRLASRLLEALLAAPACRGVRFLEASVTPDNPASRALFRAFARDRNAECRIEPFFSEHMFPGNHAAEALFRIGPLGEHMESNSK